MSLQLQPRPVLHQPVLKQCPRFWDLIYKSLSTHQIISLIWATVVWKKWELRREKKKIVGIEETFTGKKKYKLYFH